jgi:hypothetical protein
MSSEEIAVLRGEVSQLKARLAELEVAVNPARKNEEHYQKVLESQLAATHLHIPGVGVTDLTTPDSHIEIKRFRDYHVVPGQLAKYNRVVPRPRKCVYFFGPLPKQQRLVFIADLMAESGIEMYIFDSDDVPYRHLTASQLDGNASLVRQYVESELERCSSDRFLEWVILFADFRKYAKENQDHQATRWKSDETKTLFSQNGVMFRHVAEKDDNGKTTRNLRGVWGWKVAV